MAKKVIDVLNNTIEKVRDTDISTILNDARNKIENISKNPSRYMLDVIIQAKLVYNMAVCYRKNECRFPWKTAAALIAVLVYFINPFDIIPDFIPGVGYIDDLAAFGIALKLIKDDLQSYAEDKNLDLQKYGLE